MTQVPVLLDKNFGAGTTAADRAEADRRRDDWNAARTSEQSRSFWSATLRRFLTNRVGVIAAIIVLLLVLGAIFAPLITSANPLLGRPTDRLQNLGAPGHLLGTDEQGRDMLARVLYGGRLSLLAGFVPTIGAALIG